MKQKRKNVIIGIAISIVLVMLSFELPNLYSVVLYADDFHYWASGAFWAGYDWSSMVRHDFYYSYGYGFLLAPLFAFTRNGIVLFRLGIILNYLFYVAGYWLLVKIGRSVFPSVSKAMVYFVCFVACVYPAWHVHVNSAMCEALLYFLFILMVYMLIEMGRTYSRPKTLLLGFLSVYVYMVHQRMLALTIAVAGTVVVMRLLKKISKICFIEYLLTFLFTFGVHMVIKPVFQDYLYVNYSTIEYNREGELRGLLCGIWIKVAVIYIVLACILYLIHKKDLLKWVHRNRLLLLSDGIILAILVCAVRMNAVQESSVMNNDYDGIVGKFTSIFSADNFTPFLRTMAGHFFYLFVAAGGIAIYMVICSFFDVICAMKKKKWGEYEILELFTGSAALFILGLSCVFLWAKTSPRIDVIMYGRYSEFVVPVLLILGILKLRKEGVRWKEALLSLLFFVYTAYSLFGYYKQGEIFGFFTDVRFLSINTPSVYWEFSESDNGVFPAFIVGLLLFIILLCVGQFKAKAVQCLLIFIVGMVFVVQGKIAVNAYLLPQQELQNTANAIVEQIEEDYEDYDVFFMKDAYEAFHCSGYIQVRMPKVHILTLRDDQVLKLTDNSIVICDIDDLDSQNALKNAGFKVLKRCSTAVSFIKSSKLALAGEGTQKKPYLIQDREDLIWFRDAVNSGEHFTDKYFRQTADIDLKGMEWEPIGLFGTDYYFAGYYDGDGHCIKNLHIAREENCAFFAVLAGTVANLGIESGSVEGVCAAGIAGHSYGGEAKVVNCYNKADITGSYRAGGIVDNFMGYVCNCVNLGKVEAGITGEISAYDVVKAVYCYSETDNRFVQDTFTGWEYKNGIIIPDIPETVLTVNQLNRNAFWLKQDISVNLGKLCYWRYEDGEVLFAEDSPYSDWKYVRTLFLMKMASFVCLIAAGSVLFWVLIIRTEYYKLIQMAISAGRKKCGGLIDKAKKLEKTQIEDRM